MIAPSQEPTWRDCGPVVRQRCADVTPEVVDVIAGAELDEYERRAAAEDQERMASLRMALFSIFAVVAIGLAFWTAFSFTPLGDL